MWTQQDPMRKTEELVPMAVPGQGDSVIQGKGISYHLLGIWDLP